jgi:hypothetical protein
MPSCTSNITSDGTSRIIEVMAPRLSSKDGQLHYRGSVSGRAAVCPAPRTGKGEHHPGSLFRPRRDLLPGKVFLNALWPRLVAPPVALLKIQHLQTLQVFLKSLTNERGAIHFPPPCCHVRSLEEFCIKDNLYGLHVEFYPQCSPQQRFCDRHPESRSFDYSITSRYTRFVPP